MSNFEDGFHRPSKMLGFGPHIEDLHRRLKHLEDKEIFLELSSWIEEARSLIMLDQESSIHNWKEFVKNKENHPKIRLSAWNLFGLTYQEWRKLSVEFKWNSSEDLSKFCDQNKALFGKLISGVKKLRGVEEPAEY